MAATPPAARSAGDTAPGETWLPIRRAAEILGVSVATLRLWTAAGKLQASTTPGVHRRYAEGEVRRLLAERPDPAWDSAAQELVATLRTRYAQLARDEVRRQAWFSSFDDAARPEVNIFQVASPYLKLRLRRLKSFGRCYKHFLIGFVSLCLHLGLAGQSD